MVFRKGFKIKSKIFLCVFELKKINEDIIIMYGNIPIGNNKTVNKWKKSTRTNPKTLVLL